MISRLAYFPRPYLNETVYSWLARYAFHRGHLTTESTYTELIGYTGHSKYNAPADFPNHLEAIASRLPGAMALTAEQIAWRHTTLAYHVAYRDAENVRSILSWMVEGRSLAPDPGRRLNNNWVRADHLRYCDSCFDHMEKHNQELHWLRVHQIPIVLVCPEHGEALRNGPAPALSPSRLCRATRQHEANSVLNEPIDPATRKALQEIARMAAKLLITTPEGPEAASLVRQLFKKKGYRRNDQIDQVAVRVEAVDVLAPLVPCFPDIMEKGKGGLHWLEKFANRPDRRQTDSVVLAAFLVARLEERPNNAPATKAIKDPFGKGPWPCFNPLAEHTGLNVVDQVRKTKQRNHYAGVFSCKCGHSYRRIRRADGNLSDPVTIEIGSLLRPWLDKVMMTSTPSRAARRLGMPYRKFRRLYDDVFPGRPWGKIAFDDPPNPR